MCPLNSMPTEVADSMALASGCRIAEALLDAMQRWSPSDPLWCSQLRLAVMVHAFDHHSTQRVGSLQDVWLNKRCSPENRSCAMVWFQVLGLSRSGGTVHTCAVAPDDGGGGQGWEAHMRHMSLMQHFGILRDALPSDLPAGCMACEPVGTCTLHIVVHAAGRGAKQHLLRVHLLLCGGALQPSQLRERPWNPHSSCCNGLSSTCGVAVCPDQLPDLEGPYDGNTQPRLRSARNNMPDIKGVHDCQEVSIPRTGWLGWLPRWWLDAMVPLPHHRGRAMLLLHSACTSEGVVTPPADCGRTRGFRVKQVCSTGYLTLACQAQPHKNTTLC